MKFRKAYNFQPGEFFKETLKICIEKDQTPFVRLIPFMSDVY